MTKCSICGKEGYLHFSCSYCGQSFCNDHRLPEQHMCPMLNERSWSEYKKHNAKHIPVRIPFKLTEREKRKQIPRPQVIKKRRSKWPILVLCVFVIFLSWAYFNGSIMFPNDETNSSSLISQLDEIGERGIQDFNEFKDTLTEAIQNLSRATENLELFEKTDLKEVELLIFKYTNIERKNHGVNELIWDERLVEIAREHSGDIADNNFFEHTNLNGENPTDRAKRHGYSLYKDLGGGWYSEGIAENIGKMPTGNVLGVGYVNDDADSIAKAQVDSLMDSPGHRANILNPDYDKIGVGVAYDGTYYISTQNFW